MDITDSSPYQWTKWLRKAAFRRAFFLSAWFAVAMLLLSGFIYWQTVCYFRDQIDRNLFADAQKLVDIQETELETRLSQILQADPGLMRTVGLFDKNNHPIAGNLHQIPSSDARLGNVGSLTNIQLQGDAAKNDGIFRGIVIPLLNETRLVFGRRVDELAELEEIISRGLGLSLLPLLILAIFAGMSLSQGAMLRIEAVEHACRRIMAGYLDIRLPISNARSEFDILSATVNRMLDEIQRLMIQIKTAGDTVAQDLRVPLIRLKARLGHLSSTEENIASLRSMIEVTLTDANELLARTHRILRLSEIENGYRRASFKKIDLVEILESVYDFYVIIAEEKQIVFSLNRPLSAWVFGDAELILEAIANLIDQAIRNSERGTFIHLTLLHQTKGVLVQIKYSQSKIVPTSSDTQASCNDPIECDSGLAFVNAVVRLHGFQLSLSSAEEDCLTELRIPVEREEFIPESFKHLLTHAPT